MVLALRLAARAPPRRSWGSGFDGTRTKRAWAPLAVTRCLDQAALAPVVLDAVEQVIGPGAQLGITCAIQVQADPYLGFVNGRHPRDWLMNDQPREPGPRR
jgi:hypothetical protein